MSLSTYTSHKGHRLNCMFHYIMLTLLDVGVRDFTPCASSPGFTSSVANHDTNWHAPHMCIGISSHSGRLLAITANSTQMKRTMNNTINGLLTMLSLLRTHRPQGNPWLVSVAVQPVRPTVSPAADSWLFHDLLAACHFEF